VGPYAKQRSHTSSCSDSVFAPMKMTELSYVGTRPYIRGADLYAWFDRHFCGETEELDRPKHVRRFKLISEVRRDGCWSEGHEAGASASLELVDGRGNVRRYAFRETGPIIERRTVDLPSVIGQMNRTGDFAGTAKLARIYCTVDFLNGLIEANKLLHAETLKTRSIAADGIRLIYIENFAACGGSIAESTLEFRHLGERRAADRTYTLNAVRVDGGGDTMRICYSY